MKFSNILLLACFIPFIAQAASPTPQQKVSSDQLIAPATPLVAVDPYFSIWSSADRLADADTTHLTGKAHRLTSIVVEIAPAKVKGFLKTVI